jgi:hypothetical protein
MRSKISNSNVEVVKIKFEKVSKFDTENIVYNFLIDKYKKDNIVFQYKPDWCVNPKTKKQLTFDFYIKNLGVIIEVDGVQHFKNTKDFKKSRKTRTRDVYKQYLAYKNNIKVIRICQTDIIENKLDWITILQKEIHNKTSDNVIYISTYPSLYNSHKKLYTDCINGKLDLQKYQYVI